MGTPAGIWPLPAWIVLVLATDQAVKAWAAAALREHRPLASVPLEGRRPLAPSPLEGRRPAGSAPAVRIRPVLTRRTLAGRLGLRPVLLWCAWLGCLLAVALLAPGAGRFQSGPARVGLGAALGGAAGNLVDLVVRGGVVDYVELGRWPAFNLADVAIVAGVIGALLAG